MYIASLDWFIKKMGGPLTRDTVVPAVLAVLHPPPDMEVIWNITDYIYDWDWLLLISIALGMYISGYSLNIMAFYTIDKVLSFAITTCRYYFSNSGQSIINFKNAVPEFKVLHVHIMSTHRPYVLLKASLSEAMAFGFSFWDGSGGEKLR